MSVCVLIVEDSREMRTAFRELLENLGGFAVAAEFPGETGATEWLQLNRQRWDVAVIDLMLSEGSGFNLIARCRTARRAAEIIVFSDFATPVIKQRCIDLGADAVFSKGEADKMADYLEGVRDRTRS